MPWQYGTLPDALRLPACPRCHNRLGVTMVLRCVFVCGDCQQYGRPFAFTAIWVREDGARIGHGLIDVEVAG